MTNDRRTESEATHELERLEAGVRPSLEAWRLAPLEDDLEALAESLPRAHGHSVHGLRPALLGVAAAAVAFASLALLGARVERQGERVTLSLELPWSSSTTPAEPDVAALATAAARHATTQAMAAFLESNAKGVRAFRAEERAERLRLARAMDEVLAAERARTELLLDALRRGTTAADRETRAAVARLVAHVQEESE